VSSFIEYFEKLVAMLQQLSDNLARLRLYAKLYPGKEALRISLLKMYGYVLEFCLKSRKVFLDAKTHKCKVSCLTSLLFVALIYLLYSF
jgi:hypothetical protein